MLAFVGESNWCYVLAGEWVVMEMVVDILGE
jgi:hypothetical protein